jgi:ribonuclease HII
VTKNDLFKFDRDFLNYPSFAEGSKSVDFGGGSFLIGTDEAGRGPGAGGVFASAVYFPNPNNELIEKLSGLNDSKKLSKKKREELYDVILENTINSTICIEVQEIEKINILNASLKAMKLACENVINEMQRRKDAKMQSDMALSEERALEPCHCEESCLQDDAAIQKKESRLRFLPQQQKILVLVDGNKLIKDFTYPQKFIIKGDAKSASIAAASILAKVSRDRYMEELDEKYPQYNWKQNAGYLTAEHLAAIEKHGITPHHRQSFLKKFEARQLKLC